MKLFKPFVFFGCLFALSTSLLQAEVKVVTEKIDLAHATAEFKFKEVPVPAKSGEATNAAFNARLMMVDGDKDANSGDLEVLHDGKLPGEQDEPTGNFFFNAGTDGGRLSFDLGKVIDIKQVNTYSWHTDTRAPQVYSLYGADGSAAGFNSIPGKDVDPSTCGWKLIAKVDTRPKVGDVGGQYGASISDTTGTLGRFRYLLMVISRTEADDDYGNTFYSEVSIIDAKEMIKTPAPAGDPKADQPGIKTVQMDGGKYTATIDTTEAPDLTDWADKELAPVVAEWYPQLVKMLPSPGYSAPSHFSITFRADKPGVADTAGTRINCSAAWYRGQLKNEAKGSIVHEMVHVVQQYGSARRDNPNSAPNPGWMVEGIPDYLRWYFYEPKSNGTAINKHGLAKARYDGSYRVTANFLHFVVQKYDKDLIEEMDAAMRQGTYSPDLWKKFTGKSVDELNEAWKADLGKSLGV